MVRITAAGRTFQKETRGILTQLARAEEAVRRTGDPAALSLDIAFNSSLLSSNLVGCFRRFRAARPDIRLTLHDCLAVDQVAAVRNGRLDVGFVGFAPEKQDEVISFKLWAKEPLIVLLPDEHPLGKKKRIRIQDLQGLPMVSLYREAEPAFRDFISKLFGQAGFSPNITQEASRAQAVAVMAIAGATPALLPRNMTTIIEGGQARDLFDHRGKQVFLDHMVVTLRRPGKEVGEFLKVANQGN